MLPTLYIGDYHSGGEMAVRLFALQLSVGHCLLSRAACSGGLPSRGDVVVFRHPTEDSDLIKRVIGLPGDTVEVRRGRLVLNGREVPRRPLAPVRVPVTANSPCRAVPPATPTVIVTSGPAALRLSRLSRNTARRPELHRARSGQRWPRRRFRPRPRASRPHLPDGRQSRRQPRQPLPDNARVALACFRSRT